MRKPFFASASHLALSSSLIKFPNRYESRSTPRITIGPGTRFGSSSHSFPLKNLPRAPVFTRGAESREQFVIRDISLRAITALCLHTRYEIQYLFNFNVSEMVEFRQESFTVGQSLAHRYLLLASDRSDYR
jgi:hypothetical protein